MPSDETRPKVALPKINNMLMGGFRRFNRWYLRKNFHTIAVQRELLDGCEIQPSDAFVVYANHPSWWDPLMAMYLADAIFPKHRMFAPIDADAFEKYRMFGQMGFYPLKQDSLEGAANFLKISRAILSEAGNSIWITPEGRFCDVRDQEAKLMPGLSHLAVSLLKKSPAGSVRKLWFIAAGVEYAFWEERTPEAFLRFAEPILIERADAEARMGDKVLDKTAWDERITSALRNAQTELAAASMARDPSQFDVVASSSSGSFFIYDWWRKLVGGLTGRKINTQHGEKF